MDKPRSVEYVKERREEMVDGIIIEKEIPLSRRIIELIITLFFNALIVFMVIILIDDVYMVITGSSGFLPFISSEIAQIGVWGLVVIILLFPTFHILANIWLRFKKYLYDPEDHVMEVPTFIRDDEMAEYFQLPVEEIKRRQDADELIVYDNIDNERMKVLRKQHTETIFGEDEKDKKTENEN